jgi:hypothetical protein
METTSVPPPPNPPSVEAAYKRKCVALKKRLNEIEAENENIRTRNKRSLQYVQKMRLESCILLERLSKVTGMIEEAQNGTTSPEVLRARAAAIISGGGASSTLSAGNGDGVDMAGGYLDDETEGSSEDRPPTVGITPSPRKVSPLYSLFIL